MKNTVNAEIIAIGTELLLGQIANTNAQWMSQQLALHGMNTYYHTVVGDNLERMIATIEQALQRSNVIIISGGLGPTKDDLSREAFSHITNIPIVEEKNSLQKIVSFFEKHNIEMTPNNKLQARVFKESIVLENKWGMAPGNIVEYNNKTIVFLPGVPKEMKQIFSDSVIPYLKALNGEMVIQSKVLKFIGIGESALEHKLQVLIDKQHNPTIAPLSHKDGVIIRITAKAETIEEANRMLDETKEEILSFTEDYYYGENDESIESIVCRLMKDANKTVAAAESLTGGAFQKKIVSVPGASNVFKGGIVSYATEIKEHVLNVPRNIIENDGTVSYACAKAMAESVQKLMNAHIGISFTGVAGPDPIEGKPVGTVFIGLVDRDGYEQIEKIQLHGDRNQIRHRSVLKGYEMLLKYLKNNFYTKNI